MNKDQVDHDRLFKELLETFFAEFMQLFFPAASQAIDFTHLRFLQQEVFTDVTAGERHAVDILVETRLKEEPGLIRLKLDPARTELIGGFFETYLKLNRQEEEEFYRELGKIDQREVEGIMQITTSWHEKGREEGITAGQVNLLLKQIKKRFGELPAEVEAKIRVLNSEEIEKIGESLFDLAGIDDLKKLLPVRN